MNYPAGHHTYSAVPFYNLPRLRKALQSDMPTPIKGCFRGLRHVLRLNHA